MPSLPPAFHTPLTKVKGGMAMAMKEGEREWEGGKGNAC